MITLIILSTFFSCKDAAKKRIKETILTTIEEIEKKSSASYEVVYRVKYLGEKDTIDMRGNVDLIREETDTLFGGKVWFEADNGQKKYYDLNHFYVFDSEDEIVHKHEAHEEKVFKGSATSNLKDIYFLKPNYLTEEIEEGFNVVTFGDTLIDNELHYYAKVKKPDDLPFSNAVNTYYINLNDACITRITQTIAVNGEPQHKEWNIRQLYYDTLSNKSLDQRFSEEAKNYILAKHVKSKGKAEPPIADGNKIPELNGTYYGNGKAFSLEKHGGKPKLLFFWKLDCEPCEESISPINDLFYKYKKTDLEIVAFYKTDDTEETTLQLRSFIADKDMDYPAVMTDKKTFSSFKVFGYPTIYIVNEKNEVIYSQVGYSENTLSHIDKCLTTLFDQ